MTDQLQTVLDSFEKRLGALEKAAGVEGSAGSRSLGPSSSGAPAKVQEEVPAFVKDFDDYCTTYLNPFVEACEKLGGGAASGGAVVKKAWGAQRDFLMMAAACKKPDQGAMMEKMKPLQECMKEAGGNRARDEFENHTRAVEEAMGCVSWLIMGPPSGLPKEMVEPTIGGSDYWANKVRMKYRSTNPDQVAFCDTLKALLTHLLEYVLSHHKTGVSWNPKGGDVSAYSLSAGGGAESAPPVPPPMPPPMPPPASVSAEWYGCSDVDKLMKGVAYRKRVAPARPPMNALFGDISKGLDVTKGLKKVARHQQTWRSEYKAEGASPVTHAASSKPTPKPSTGPKGPPKMEFVQQGMKWIVENQSSSEGVVTIEITNMKHQIYIYGCMGATIDIKGKCKMVAIDSCKKTQVLLDDAISSVELVNCQRMKVQVRGAVPSVAVDKTDGFLCYLSEAGLSTKFVTSKSSEMNVAFPKPGTEDEQMEMPIPEQFQHVLELEPSPRINSDVSDLYSH